MVNYAEKDMSRSVIHDEMAGSSIGMGLCFVSTHPGLNDANTDLIKFRINFEIRMGDVRVA